MSAESVKNAEPENVPIKTPNKLLQPDAIPSIMATAVDMTPREITLDSTYSEDLTGETAMELMTLWLFSSKAMAPMKKSPIAAGSENINKAAAVCRRESLNKLRIQI